MNGRRGYVPRPFFGLLPIITIEILSRIAPMKKQSFGLLFVAACLCLAGRSARGQSQTVSIMPMGDSVTARGGNPESSYRYWLYVDLTNAGFMNTVFVGSTTGNNGASDGPPANFLPANQQRYEGGSSPGPDAWTAGLNGVNDAPHAASVLGNSGPTILLLDLGANDYNEGATSLKTNLLQVQASLETIIQTFAQANANTIIILARPTGAQSPTDPGYKKYLSSLGSAVSKAAKNQKKLGVNIETINLFGGYNVNTDTKDGTHPNVKGEQEIAKKYFNKLKPILKKL